MQRLNVLQLYRLGRSIRLIGTIGDKERLINVYFNLVEAEQALDDFLEQHQIGLVTAQQPARDLIYVINRITSPSAKENTAEYYEAPLGEYALAKLKEALHRFETVFEAELAGRTDTYIVSKKGIYDTVDLIEGADRILSEKVLKVFPEQVTRDLRQAGRCLAFELNTACGFHLMRAVETAIHTYYVTVTEHSPKRKDRNWGAYVRNLNKHKRDIVGSKVDARLVFLIDQIRDHHRNALMHPEDTLTAAEAITLFGISQSAITAFATATNLILNS